MPWTTTTKPQHKLVERKTIISCYLHEITPLILNITHVVLNGVSEFKAPHWIATLTVRPAIDAGSDEPGLSWKRKKLFPDKKQLSTENVNWLLNSREWGRLDGALFPPSTSFRCYQTYVQFFAWHDVTGVIKSSCIHHLGFFTKNNYKKKQTDSKIPRNIIWTEKKGRWFARLKELEWFCQNKRNQPCTACQNVVSMEISNDVERLLTYQNLVEECRISYWKFQYHK